MTRGLRRETTRRERTAGGGPSRLRLRATGGSSASARGRLTVYLGASGARRPRGLTACLAAAHAEGGGNAGPQSRRVVSAATRGPVELSRAERKNRGTRCCRSARRAPELAEADRGEVGR